MNREPLVFVCIREYRVADATERQAAGVRALPRSLGQALDGLAASEAAQERFGDRFVDVYPRFKRAELRVVDGLSEAAMRARYDEIY